MQKRSAIADAALVAVMTAAFWLTLTRCGHSQVRLMSAEKETALRASIPPLDDAAMEEKISQAMLYTEAEMPPAYQFQPINGGVGASSTVFYSPYVRLNSIDPFTNGNREFPWRNPGGTDTAENVTDEFRFIYLPKQADGRPWPMVVYRDVLEKSDSVNMPIPLGWRWIYPAGTTIGEVLCMTFSDGLKYTYEIRTRTREIDDWDVDIFRPFPTMQSLKERLADIDQRAASELENVRIAPGRLEDKNHPRRAFVGQAGVFTLPRLSREVSAFLLTTATFKSSVGQTFSGDAFAPLASHDESIVPRGYTATFLGTDRTTCINCHKHTLRHVDRFQNRDWYGYIRGSDGIFSPYPFDPSCIGPPDKPVRLRPEFVSAGMVEMYDQSRHPVSMYQALRDIENLPAAFYPNTGQRTIRN